MPGAPTPDAPTPDAPTPDASTPVDPALPVHLSTGDLSLVVDVSTAVPRILHWGAALDAASDDLRLLQSTADRIRIAEGVAAPIAPTVLPLPSDGWVGTPGIEGHRAGRRFSPFFRAERRELLDAAGERVVRATAVDDDARLGLEVSIALLDSGVVRLDAVVTNAGHDEYELDAVRLTVPVPREADELLDFAGRHLRERSPQRGPFLVGTHSREGRRGRTGSDATPVLAAGTTGFGFRSGEVWTVHTAWSGNHRTFAERGLGGTTVLGGGEVLLPGELRLAPGESYRAPSLYASYGVGLDAAATRFHEYLRSRPQHPRSPRPVVLNTWEAVYFDHDLDALIRLAERGARVGAERFVLDDGWFRGRRDDTAGLGDWQVDEGVWPDGLGPLVDAVRALGMDFGLWFEPEMINEDSDLARAHPDWILAPGERMPRPGRHQQVLNLAHPDAYRYILEAMSDLVERHRIDYIKWDHNRDLIEAGDRTTGEAGVHRQTLAVYALIDELRARHPQLEIESCSSGGGRVDLGILQRTDRVWASDSIDALERQQIQRWTGQLIPPELIGSHVGSPVAHTTRRSHSLSFRAATALFGHFGIEWNLSTASDDDLDELAEWIGLYKRERELLHTGVVVRADSADPAYWAHGVVAADGSSALFAFVATATGVAADPGRIRLPGLRDDVRYRVEPIELTRASLTKTAAVQPAWVTERQTVGGSTLARVGLHAPRLFPEQAFLFRLIAE